PSGPRKRAPKRLSRLKSDYPGWDKYSFGRAVYYTGPDEEAGDYIATDANDTVVAEGATWGEVVQNLQKFLGVYEAPTVGGADHMKPASKDDLDKFAKVFGKRIPPGWHDIHLTLDPSQRFIAY